MRRLLLTAVAAIGALLSAASPAAGSQGSISFHIDVSGKGYDSINGHAYSVSGTYSVAQVRDGGRSGTYTDRQAYRLYPAKLNQQIAGVTIHATWHCTTTTNKTQSY
jgi:hypothetical protein